MINLVFLFSVTLFASHMSGWYVSMQVAKPTYDVSRKIIKLEVEIQNAVNLKRMNYWYIHQFLQHLYGKLHVLSIYSVETCDPSPRRRSNVYSAISSKKQDEIKIWSFEKETRDLIAFCKMWYLALRYVFCFTKSEWFFMFLAILYWCFYTEIIEFQAMQFSEICLCITSCTWPALNVFVTDFWVATH